MKVFNRVLFTQFYDYSRQLIEPAKPEEKKGVTLIEKENVETGSVKLGVYWYYTRVIIIIISIFTHIIILV